MAETAVIRDPIYGPIPLDPIARELIDTPAFQRLRRVQQLSLASLVYPSAIHTRFEHSIGVYHLTRSVVQNLERKGDLAAVAPEAARILPYAGLLHDLSQHMSAHVLDEFGVDGIQHEELGARTLAEGRVGEILRTLRVPDIAFEIGDIINQRSSNPLAGIVAGNCDADKMDYIVRDAYHCGLPIGYDQAYLRDAITLLPDPATGALTIGIESAGLSSFEQMLYSKNALYRSVYFHRTARAAMAMLRALVLYAKQDGLLDAGELHQWADSELFTVIQVRVQSSPDANRSGSMVMELVERIMARNLYKPAVSLALSDIEKPTAR